MSPKPAFDKALGEIGARETGLSCTERQHVKNLLAAPKAHIDIASSEYAAAEATARRVPRATSRALINVSSVGIYNDGVRTSHFFGAELLRVLVCNAVRTGRATPDGCCMTRDHVNAIPHVHDFARHGATG